MTGNGAPAPELEPATPPRIVITFAGPGAADCTITFEGNVSNAQLYGAAWLIEAGAREARAVQVTGALAQSLVRAPAMPPGPIPFPRRS